MRQLAARYDFPVADPHQLGMNTQSMIDQRSLIANHALVYKMVIHRAANHGNISSSSLNQVRHRLIDALLIIVINGTLRTSILAEDFDGGALNIFQ